MVDKRNTLTRICTHRHRPSDEKIIHTISVKRDSTIGKGQVQQRVLLRSATAAQPIHCCVVVVVVVVVVVFVVAVDSASALGLTTDESDFVSADSVARLGVPRDWLP